VKVGILKNFLFTDVSLNNLLSKAVLPEPEGPEIIKIFLPI